MALFTGSRHDQPDHHAEELGIAGEAFPEGLDDGLGERRRLRPGGVQHLADGMLRDQPGQLGHVGTRALQHLGDVTERQYQAPGAQLGPQQLGRLGRPSR
nr:hypothetical protein GCM10020092_008800 [Actinoplanes digitatis]